MRPSATKPTDNFWDRLSAELSKEGERTPEGQGWKSLDELVKFYNMHRTNVGAMLMRGVRAGKLERFVGRKFRNDKLQLTTWYRPAP